MSGSCHQPWSFGFLCLSPLLIAIVGGLGALGVPSTFLYALGLILIAVILRAAWTLGARAIRASAPERRRPATAGALLATVMAVLTIIAVMGPPQSATAAVNQTRYCLLLFDAIAVACALIVLREALAEAGERFHSTLGFTAILIAGPQYILFTAMQLLEYRARESAGSEVLPSDLVLMDHLSLILLFVGAGLTYLATAAFAVAMERVQWLGRTASRVYTTLSLLAAACVGVRVVEALASTEGPLWGFRHWSSLPGFILLVPAMPWIMPCLLGIVLLKQAGEGALNEST